MMKAKGSKAIVWTTALCAFGLVVGLSACAPNADKAGRADQKATDKPVAQQVEQTPDADEYGVVHADQWAGDYPYQYRSYKQNDAPFAFGGANVQAERLMADGVEVADGKVDLTRYGIK